MEATQRRYLVRLTDRINPGEALVTLVLRRSGDGVTAGEALAGASAPSYVFRRARFRPEATASMGARVLTRLAGELAVKGDTLEELRSRVGPAEQKRERLEQVMPLEPGQAMDLERSGWLVLPCLTRDELAELHTEQLEQLAERASVDVDGSGAGGRVVKSDLVAALEALLSPATDPAPAAPAAAGGAASTTAPAEPLATDTKPEKSGDSQGGE